MAGSSRCRQPATRATTRNADRKPALSPFLLNLRWWPTAASVASLHYYNVEALGYGARALISGCELNKFAVVFPTVHPNPSERASSTLIGTRAKTRNPGPKLTLQSSCPV